MIRTNLSKTWFASSRLIRIAASPVLIPARMIISGTFMYPFMGIYYFFTHPILWAYLFTIFLPQIVLTMVVFFFMYLFFYPISAAFAFLFNGPTGLFTAWIALLQQSTVIAGILGDMFLLPTPMKMLFDSILSREGLDDIVVAGKQKRPTPVPPPQTRVKVLLKHLPLTLVFPTWLVRLTVTVLLHFIPIIGPFVAILVNAPRRGRNAHARYFELKMMPKFDIEQFTRVRRGQYLGFGMVAGALEAIPFLGLLFAFTNCTGGALWAVAIERRTRSSAQPSARGRAQQLMVG
ncbi:hypothetical protein CJU89_6605 [Yarrowia sp. B02]|nr:hypothetical protein CJU89_6605 [Yarrowia sp. B02]